MIVTPKYNEFAGQLRLKWSRRLTGSLHLFHPAYACFQKEFNQ